MSKPPRSDDERTAAWMSLAFFILLFIFVAVIGPSLG
jgi:hypothetical protein